MENRVIETELKPFGEPGETREALIVGMLEGLSEPADSLRAIDTVAANIIGAAMSSGDFAGRSEQTLLLHSPKQTGPRRIILAGLGKAEELDDEKVRRTLTAALFQADKCEIETASIDLGSLAVAGPDLVRCAELAAETAGLALWRQLAYRSKLEDSEAPKVASVELLWPEREVTSEAEEAVAHGIVAAGSACLARDLAGRPSNELYPETLADVASAIADRHGFAIEVFDEDALAEMGMNALLSVGRGSARPPRLIVLDSDSGSDEKPVALVGKGITFDSGGISIKPSKGMEEMKGDMSGAAAVLAAADGLGRLAFGRRVVVAVPAAENMPGADAQRPGDIWKSHEGITIEVINTDAEGRLALADALSYINHKFEPKRIIDLATLTGACWIALGDIASGLMGNDDQLCRELERAGERSGERVWRLPLWRDYDEHLKSKIADVKNTGERGGGAISAAMFLKRFVGETAWAHIDIAGPAWLQKRRGYIPEGPTGVGARLLIEALTRQMRF